MILRMGRGGNDAPVRHNATCHFPARRATMALQPHHARCRAALARFFEEANMTNINDESAIASAANPSFD
ncbi:hypothetical protein, partial [Streptococcus pneumoniae]|uniref:hypothetical protein n=1 Tax=Streptococcus pneumoniae TaxID=1313 RepID=UPI001E3B4F96